MTEREKLIELLTDTLHDWECDAQPETVSQIAEHLLENGVIVPLVKDDCYYGKVIKVVQTERTMDIYIKRNKQGSASPAPAVPTAREDS